MSLEIGRWMFDEKRETQKVRKKMSQHIFFGFHLIWLHALDAFYPHGIPKRIAILFERDALCLIYIYIRTYASAWNFFINSKMWTLLCNVLFVLKISALFGWNSAFNTNFSMQSIILLYSGALYSMQSRQFRLYNNRFVATYILDISFRLLGLFSLLSHFVRFASLFYVHFYFFWFLFISFEFFVLLPLECRYMIFNLHWL